MANAPTDHYLPLSEALRKASNRAWNNLNRVAAYLVESAQADTPEKAIPVHAIAKQTKLDPSNLKKLLANRPGFVKVTSNGKSMGYYYLSDFHKEAQKGGPGNYYPYNTIPLLYDPRGILIEKQYTIVTTEEVSTEAPNGNGPTICDHRIVEITKNVLDEQWLISVPDNSKSLDFNPRNAYEMIATTFAKVEGPDKPLSELNPEELNRAAFVARDMARLSLSMLKSIEIETNSREIN